MQFQAKGPRSYQEDRYKIIEPGGVVGRENLAFFAVYDGHGGDAVSGFNEQYLHDLFFERLQDQLTRENFDEAVNKTFKEVDRQLRKEGLGQKEGSTVSMVLLDLNTGTLSAANVGDSYIFIGEEDEDGKLHAFKLSRTHSPREERERQRIEEAGGAVYCDNGEDRIGEFEVPLKTSAMSTNGLTSPNAGSVNMSRALGDLDLKKTPQQGNKKKLSRALGSTISEAMGLIRLDDKAMKADWISNIPHTDRFSLTAGRRSILLLASDGIGLEEDCASCLRWTAGKWKKGKRTATEMANTMAGKSSMNTTDNSTVIIVLFE